MFSLASNLVKLNHECKKHVYTWINNVGVKKKQPYDKSDHGILIIRL